MKSRKSRLVEIVEILSHNNISSQEELLRHLATRGFIITQATLSRDLKRLRTTKVATDMGNYRYIVVPDTEDFRMVKNPSLTIQSSHHPAVISIRFSGHVIVIKTRPGYASGVAYDLEMLRSNLILGTIAGADTVIAIVDDRASRADLIELLTPFLTPEVLTAAAL